ncbi:MAG: TIGR00730 family Rossman fold protein [Patescibacteria group bacterium]
MSPKKDSKDTSFTLASLEKEASRRGARINKEFLNAFTFIKKTDKSVTFFGSTRVMPNSKHYKQARILAEKIVKKLGHSIVTGGGPGIMEAGNRGAKESGGVSIGFNIILPYEQSKNQYLTESLDFYYFFSRKVALYFSAEACVFFPGGFGTLDELFDLLTLVQTGKTTKMPIILIGKDYWDPLNTFIKKHLYNAHKFVDLTDMDLYTITDDLDEVIEIIRKAPIRRE